MKINSHTSPQKHLIIPRLNTLLIAIVGFVLMSHVANGQSSIDSTYYRNYQIGFSPYWDLNNVSTNGMNAFKIGNDLFANELKPLMPTTIGNISEGVVSFALGYLTMIWTHEFGHYMRAKQVGGHFNIHNFSLPIPYTTMDLPMGASLQDQALVSVAGFEINYLSAQKIENDFYQFNGLYNDELSMAFANKMMYPIYAFMVVPRDPEKKQTWIDTAGDPVHFTKPVWERFSTQGVFMPDSTVNKGLVNFYKEAALLSLFVNLADPAFYKQVSAVFGSANQGKRPWFLLGNSNNGWAYGTMFNTSILGYEIFLNNYFKIDNRLLIVRLKSGRPFKNNSLVFSSPNIYQSHNLMVGAELEVWDQDIFGKGLMISSNLSYKLGKNIDYNMQLGYKTKGYTIGRTIDANLIFWTGLSFNISN